MPYTRSKSAQIHYIVDGDGPALVLQHGFFGSAEDWYDYGYVARLRREYQLILVDARGHGATDKPHQTEPYARCLFADDIAAILDDLHVDKCHYMGFSMGVRIGLTFARFYPARILSLTMMGMHAERTAMASMRQAAESLEQWAPQLAGCTPAHRARLLLNDRAALAALSYSDLFADLSDGLNKLDVPCLILAGDRDEEFERIRQTVPKIRNATFVQLDGYDHVDTLTRSEKVLASVMPFLANACRSAVPGPISFSDKGEEVL